MKLIIAGSRTVFPGIKDIDAAGDQLLFVLDDVTEVFSGGAMGADDAGERWAAHRGIKVVPFLPDYDRHGKYWGPKRRNREMAHFADLALVFWDGHSSGSADMVTRMAARDKPVRVIPMKPYGLGIPKRPRP